MARRKKEDLDATTLEGEFADEGTGDTQLDSTDSDTSSVAGRVVDSAKEAASQAKQTASNVVDQAKDRAASRIDQQRQTAASGVQAVAQAFRSMGDELRNRQEGPVAQYAAEIGHAIGGRAERLASYLRQRDVRQMVTDAEDFARRSPAVFLGSAFVLGLAASRFLKSSRPLPNPFEHMPDPNRALPPASGVTTESTQSYGRDMSTGTSSATGPNSPRVRSRSTAESFSSGSGDVGTSGSQGISVRDVDLDEAAGL
ncbi:MAG: hypothetical protein ACJ74Z_20775 [Bryobacteraceae bacterium]|jgi:hypothetical protein